MRLDFFTQQICYLLLLPQTAGGFAVYKGRSKEIDNAKDALKYCI